MWDYIDHFKTSSKVIYDKTADTIAYYMGKQIKEDDDADHNVDKNIDNDIEFKDDNNNCRIYPTIGYIDSYKGCITEPTLIVDNIYLGSAYNAASSSTLKRFNITVIINATTEIRNYFPDEFTYYRYSLYDNNKNSIDKYLDDSFSKIKHHQDNTGGNILIHCFMGASRSVSIVVNYLIKTMKNNDGSSYTFEEALQFIKNKRPIVNPTHKLAGDIITHNKKIDL
jgi:hypothetical protein